jgi:hypothetical protein
MDDEMGYHHFRKPEEVCPWGLASNWLLLLYNHCLIEVVLRSWKGWPKKQLG